MVKVPANTVTSSIASVGGFSPTDAILIAYVPNIGQPIAMTTVQSLSYSIHREKKSVVPLGNSYPRFVIRGSRTIAGSMTFVLTHEDPLLALSSRMKMDSDFGLLYTPLPDMITPFDIVMILQNEYGAGAYLRLYALDITDYGAVVAEQNAYVEITATYIARDIDLFIPTSSKWYLDNDNVWRKTTLFIEEPSSDKFDFKGILNERALLLVGYDRMKLIANTSISNVEEIPSDEKVHYYDKDSATIREITSRKFYELDTGKKSTIIKATKARIDELETIIENYKESQRIPLNIIERWPDDYRRELINLGYSRLTYQY